MLHRITPQTWWTLYSNLGHASSCSLPSCQRSCRDYRGEREAGMWLRTFHGSPHVHICARFQAIVWRHLQVHAAKEKQMEAPERNKA